jgi:hypothetical protein
MGNATPRKEESFMSNAIIDLGFAGLDTRKLTMLAQALETNSVVRKLCLGWNEIGDAGAERLAQSLEKNKTLTELNLTENGIGERGAERLAAALAVNGTLRVLDLMSNRIGDKGAGFFANALGKNKTLQELRLYDTGIEYTGASRLMNAAERNDTLLVLDIRWNDISDRRLVARMEQSFAKNRGAAARRRDAPLAKKGDMESYIVTMREKISSHGEYGAFVCEPEREALMTDLSGTEAWLQSNPNATIEDYRSKLDELKSVCDVVAMRYQEGIMRSQMITAIYSTIANYRGTVENSEDKYGDIPGEKRARILNACKDLEEWLNDMRQAQEHLPNFERPVLLCADMVGRNLELANLVSELLEDNHGGQAEALKEVAASSARGPASARGQSAGPSMTGNERKSQLLSYITQLQDKIAINREFGSYVSEAERERLSAHLHNAFMWTSQTTGVPTVHYIEKLQELRSVGDVIEWRCDEDSMRNDWIAAVSSTISNCRNAAVNPGDRYEKVSEEKLQKIMSACQQLEDWLKSMDLAQAGLAKYERPVLLCADMERRNLELARMVGEMLEESRGSPKATASGGYRTMPPAPAEEYSVEDDCPPPPPQQEHQAEGMPAMRGTGCTPRHTPREILSLAQVPKSPRQAYSPRGPFTAPPRGPSAPPDPGSLRDGAARLTEDERLLELEALDQACSAMVDEEDAPMAGRQMGR